MLAPLNFLDSTVSMFLGGDTKDWANAVSPVVRSNRAEETFMFVSAHLMLACKKETVKDDRIGEIEDWLMMDVGRKQRKHCAFEGIYILMDYVWLVLVWAIIKPHTGYLSLPYPGTGKISFRFHFRLQSPWFHWI